MNQNPHLNMNAWFTNISNKVFIVNWNSKPRSFEPGATKLLPAWFADHCAKHLTNHLLATSGIAGDENATSPKKPNEVPRFMHFYNQCFKQEGTKEEASKRDDLDSAIDLLNTTAPSEDSEPAKVVEPADAKEEEFEDDKPKT